MKLIKASKVPQKCVGTSLSNASPLVISSFELACFIVATIAFSTPEFFEISDDFISGFLLNVFIASLSLCDIYPTQRWLYAILLGDNYAPNTFAITASQSVTSVKFFSSTSNPERMKILIVVFKVLRMHPEFSVPMWWVTNKRRVHIFHVIQPPCKTDRRESCK